MSNPLTVLRRLIEVSPPPWRRLLAATGLGLAGAAFTLGLLAGSGYVVGRAAFRPGLGAIAGLLALVEVMAFLRAPARYGERLVVHDAAFRALARWRVWLYDKLEPLSPAGLASFRRGDLLTRAVEDVDSLQDLYVRALTPAAIAVAAAVLGVVVVAVILPAAGLVLAICLALALVVGPVLAVVARRTGPDELAARAEVTSCTVDLLRAAPDLLAFGGHSDLLARIEEADATAQRAAMRRAWWSGAGSATILLLVGAAVVGVLAVGADAVHHHHLDPVMLAVLPLAALGAFEPIPPVLAAALHASSVTEAGRRLLAFDVAAPVAEPEYPVAPPDGCPSFAFDDVSLRYTDDGAPALDGVTLTLAPGSRTVVTGASGSGKSSLVNALLRFWPLESGTLRAGDVRFDDMNQGDARRLVALGDQHARLFSGTLRRNITMSRADATAAEVDEVVDRAQLREFVSSLPQGLDTAVGEDGVQLSGGQRRRVAVARALLAAGPLLVLDEPTAGLDDAAAARLMANVLASAGPAGRTLLVLSHDRRGLDAIATRHMANGRLGPDTRG